MLQDVYIFITKLYKYRRDVVQIVLYKTKVTSMYRYYKNMCKKSSNKDATADIANCALSWNEIVDNVDDTRKLLNLLQPPDEPSIKNSRHYSDDDDDSFLSARIQE